MKTFLLRIVTPTGDLYSGEVEYLCVNTYDGKKGIMHGACECVEAIYPGEIIVKTSVVESRFKSGEGIMCVAKNGVTIALDTCNVIEIGDNSVSDEDDKQFNKLKVKLVSSIKKIKKDK